MSTDKEKRMIEGLRKLPEVAQDAFLDRITYAVFGYETRKAEEQSEKRPA